MARPVVAVVVLPPLEVVANLMAEVIRMVVMVVETMIRTTAMGLQPQMLTVSRTSTTLTI